VAKGRSEVEQALVDFHRASQAATPEAKARLEQAESEAFRERVLTRRSGQVPTKPKPLKKRPKPKADGLTLLAIGDSHAHPDYPNHRYEWLGRFIADQRPDVIWDAGDWWDMPSLSAYDKGKKCFEGRRYWRDIAAGIDAMERVEWEVKKAKGYKPRWIRTLGNHENRIHRVIEEEPMLDGIIGTHDLMSEAFGWEQYPFLESVLLENVALQHYFESGAMGRPIGGEHPAAMLLKKGFSSALAGHSHMLDYCDRYSNVGATLQTMHVGCFFDYDFHWASRSVNRIYARGLLLCRNLKDGSFDPEWWSMERIQARYG